MVFGLESRGLRTVGAFSVRPPHIGLPTINPDDVGKVLGLSAIIAVVVMVQSAATSRSFPGLPGEPPDIDRDFLGLGVGSLLSGLIGALPVNASPPRTAIVAESGGATQIAGLAAAVAIALVAGFGEPFLKHAPEAALAAILFFIASRIFRLGVMRDIARRSRHEFLLMLVTLFAVVLVPVQTGVALAIILSLIHGLWSATQSDLRVFERLPGKTIWWPEDEGFDGERLEGVKVVGIQAPLSFLNSDRFQRQLIEVGGGGGAQAAGARGERHKRHRLHGGGGPVGGDPPLPQEGRGFRGGAARILAGAGGFCQIWGIGRPWRGGSGWRAAPFPKRR